MARCPGPSETLVVAIDRFQRDKSDPSVIVFSEIKRCQLPHFTHFSKSCRSSDGGAAGISGACSCENQKNVMEKNRKRSQNTHNYKRMEAECVRLFSRQMTGAENPPPSNFRRLVLGCIETSDSESRRIF